MSKPAPAAAAKADGGSGKQILSISQEILELVKKVEARLDEQDKRIKDLVQICETTEKKLDNTRVAAASKGAGKAKGAGKKDEDKPAVPLAMPMYFKDLWKKDRAGTIAKYCKPDNVKAAETAIKKNPANAKKGEAVIDGLIASLYFTKYLGKPNSPDHDADGRKALKADHDALVASGSSDAAASEEVPEDATSDVHDDAE